MFPLVHHQCSRQSDVGTRASYSMGNQVFNRDSQGPSIHRGRAEPKVVMAYRGERERDEERKFVCVHLFLCGYTYEDRMSSQGQKDEEHFPNLLSIYKIDPNP